MVNGEQRCKQENYMEFPKLEHFPFMSCSVFIVPFLEKHLVLVFLGASVKECTVGKIKRWLRAELFTG